MKVTVIPIVIGALGTVTKGLVQELEDLEIRGRVETIQTTAFLRSARILRSVLGTWGDLLKNHQLTLMWMCKKFKFNYANKWCMHNPAPLQENDTHKLLWDLISARRPDLIIINKKKKNPQKTCKTDDFAVPADHRIKLKECEKRDKYLDLARELKKTMEHEGDYCDWCFWHGN